MKTLNLIAFLLLVAATAFSQDRRFDYQSYYDRNDSIMDVMGIESPSTLIIQGNTARLAFGNTWIDLNINERTENSHYLQYCGNLVGDWKLGTLTVDRQRHFAMLEVNGILSVELFGRIGLKLETIDD